MSVAPVSVGTSPLLDPRLDAARVLVRHGKIRAALDALTHLDGAAAATTFDRGDHTTLVALTIDCLLARGDTLIAATWGEQIAGHVVGPGAATALHTRGELASAQDAHELALDLYLAAGAAEAECPPTHPLEWRVGAALALVRCGRRREADEEGGEQKQTHCTRTLARWARLPAVEARAGAAERSCVCVYFGAR